jgi:cold shock CspA family protein
MSNVLHGYVEFFSVEKGFGFLRDQNFNKYFFHCRAIQSGVPIIMSQCTFEHAVDFSKPGKAPMAKNVNISTHLVKSLEEIRKFVVVLESLGNGRAQ